ncbi:NAD(P)/FAD-dependent oxidoreductase [Hymenobacter sp. CRA2]|uniref:NAD(P)/FAD-dependent oxidoreductase n=1 Tax=Hymenobacter sp. CRA2 TaxID=1955620 RepID=UPI00099006C0|nr:NAD(P)/FAD-dependent oxidoreductase [Hymenobacter sp. CRA2]OON66467.1 pyridine nucleotide-disulfide oxidoreductase [Hymenobacter sp. CRA2]
MPSDFPYDVLIIGGSAAGLSAATTLGRARRRVLVLDAGQPCNRPAPHSHGFLTRDGMPPAQLTAVAREQLGTYPTVVLQAGIAVRAEAHASGYRVTTAEGATYAARKLLLATGLHDELPLIPGFAECWGRSVLHCPYCHGYEVHSQPLGVLGNGDAGFEFARLIHQWSPDVRLFTNGPTTLTAEQTALLTVHGIEVIEARITAIAHEAGQLHHVELAAGSRVPLRALFARVPFRQSSDLGARLGCELTETGLLRCDEFGRTTVPGVYAAGDNSSPLRQLMAAAASGMKAGAFINHDLIAADF